MPLTKAVSEPRALFLDARVRLLRADDAAKMLAGDILGRDIDKPVRHNTLQKTNRCGHKTPAPAVHKSIVSYNRDNLA